MRYNQDLCASAPMSSFKERTYAFLNQLTQAGFTLDMSRQDKYRIRALNSLCLFCLAISSPYYFIFYFSALYGPLAVIFFAHIFFCSTLYLNYRQQYFASRLCLLIATNGSVLILSCMLGTDTGFHLYIYTAPLFVFWLFGKARLKYIFLTFLIYVGLMLFVFLYDHFATSLYTFNFDFAGFNLYRLNALLNLILIFLLFYNYFEYQNILTEDLLEKTHNLELEITRRTDSEGKTKQLFDDLTLSYNNLEQFSFVVSHNMRSPVANIKGFASLYDKENSCPENTKIVGYMEQASKHLEDILSDLNFILKNKDTALENKEELHLGELLNGIKSSLSHEIEHTGAVIEYHFEPNSLVYSIKSALRSILFNFIQNSIKYRQNWNAPIIKVCFKEEGKHYLLSITDNGIGIDLAKYQDRLFKLYSRLHLGIDGKGMGLYLVKTHVEMLGGQVQVKSEVNKGSTFLITLPVLK